MIFRFRWIVFAGFISFLCCSKVFAQTESSTSLKETVKDSTRTAPIHSPRKALIFSAVMPGLGQAYNKKYWKMPIVYAGMGTALYFALKYNTTFHQYRSQLKDLTDSVPNYDVAYASLTTQLVTEKEKARRTRDFCFIILSGIYVLNLVDAVVDAHFFTFDVSDNLSMNVSPSMPLTFQGKPVPSLHMGIKF